MTFLPGEDLNNLSHCFFCSRFLPWHCQPWQWPSPCIGLALSSHLSVQQSTESGPAKILVRLKMISSQRCFSITPLAVLLVCKCSAQTNNFAPVFKNAGKAVVTSECHTCSLNPSCIYLGHFLPFLSPAWLQLILCPGYLLIPTATFDP